MAWGVYFFAYSQAKARCQRRRGTRPLGPAQHLASAAQAGALVCLLTNPVWVAKTRMQLQRVSAAAAGTAVAAGAQQYRGLAHCLVTIARDEGMRGLYKGLLPSLLLVRRHPLAVLPCLALRSQSCAPGQALGTRARCISLHCTVLPAACSYTP
jgi:solute carrier family 25 folate transporter 32